MGVYNLIMACGSNFLPFLFIEGANADVRVGDADRAAATKGAGHEEGATIGGEAMAAT